MDGPPQWSRSPSVSPAPPSQPWQPPRSIYAPTATFSSTTDSHAFTSDFIHHSDTTALAPQDPKGPDIQETALPRVTPESRPHGGQLALANPVPRSSRGKHTPDVSFLRNLGHASRTLVPAALIYGLTAALLLTAREEGGVLGRISPGEGTLVLNVLSKVGDVLFVLAAEARWCGY
jgi:hypothetical protein